MHIHSTSIYPNPINFSLYNTFPNLPKCKDCKYFKPDPFTVKDLFAKKQGQCMLYPVAAITNRYEYSKHCRENESKCGVLGRQFLPKPIHPLYSNKATIKALLRVFSPGICVLSGILYMASVTQPPDNKVSSSSSV